MMHPRKDKLPEGSLLCKTCNGTGANAGRTDKKGNPLRCSKCKGARHGRRPELRQRG